MLRLSILLAVGCRSLHATSPLVVQYHVEGLPRSLKSLAETQLNAQLKGQYQSIQAAVAQSQQLLKEILASESYFRCDIQMHCQETAIAHQVTYFINLGPQLTMTQVNIQLIGPGKDRSSLTQKIKAFTLSKGQAMTTQNYQTIKRSLYTLVVNEGFLEAKWKVHTVVVDPEAYTATLTFVIDTGPSYTIASIQSSDNKLDVTLLKRYLNFREGDPYRLDRLLQSQITLEGSGYFKKVAVQAQTHPAQTAVPVHINLETAPKYYTSLALRYRTDPGLQFKWEGGIRRLNRWGDQLTAIVQNSERYFNGLVLYTVPKRSTVPQTHYFKLDYVGEYKNRTIYPSDFPLHRANLTLNYLYQHRYKKWELTPFAALHYEHFKPPYAQHDKHYMAPMFGFMLSSVKRNWPKELRQYQLHLEAKGATKLFFSSLNLLRLEAKFAYLNALYGAPATYFIGRMRVGLLLTNAFHDIPTSLRFYAGGVDYPRACKKHLIEAHTLSYGIELRRHLIGLFYLNPFFEMAHDVHYSKMTFKGSTGIGLCLWYPHVGHIELSGVIRINPATDQKRYGVFTKISTDLY